MSGRLVVACAVAATTLAACGTADTTGLTASPPTSRPHPRPAIDWSRPLVNGVPSSRAAARTQGRLAFDPVVPRWAVPESAVHVTDPRADDPAHAAVAFVYDFPQGPDFPTDGRVVLLQTPTELTDADLVTMAAANGAEHFRIVDIGGRPALVIEADGIGRVRLIRRGVAFDVTGPATPAATVVRLAEGLG